MTGALSSRLYRLALAGATAVALAAPLGVAHADKVGVAAAVNPDAFSSLSGSPKAQLNIGKSIFFNEHINTSKSGLVQVLLVDGSTFTVGPDSDLTIDKFVYDPNKKTGEMVATFSKGVMRFVGGKLSKNDGGVTVNTPQGALAIRGGMFMGQITGPKSAVYSFLYGVSLTLAGKGTIFEPGNSFYITSSGSTISPTTQAIINGMMAALTKVGTYNNAGSNPPTGPNPGQLTIQANNYNQIISTATAQQIQDQIQKQIDALNNTPTETPTETPTMPPSTQTAAFGYAGGIYTLTGGNQNDPRVGALVNFSPTEVTALFDAQSNAFQGAGITLYVQNGQPDAGGAKLIFGPVNFAQLTGPSQSELPDTGLFFGLANDNSIKVFDDAQLTQEATLRSGSTAVFVGANSATDLCDSCDFIKWGAWVADLNFKADGNPDSIVSAVGFWVAGDVIQDTIGALPITGNAYYSGTAWGSVWNTREGYKGPPTYVAEGDMNMSWDFAYRTGKFAITNFDEPNTGGLSFGGDLSAPGVVANNDGPPTIKPTGTANTFSGTLAVPRNAWCETPSDLRDLTGNVTGSFVSATKLADGVTAGFPKGVIGNWTIGNSVYKASGIFAGANSIPPHKPEQ
jgi:hypothetical protein